MSPAVLSGVESHSFLTPAFTAPYPAFPAQYHYNPTWALEINYYMISASCRQAAVFRGQRPRRLLRAERNGRGSRHRRPLLPDQTEIKTEPVRLTFDAGKALWARSIHNWSSSSLPIAIGKTSSGTTTTIGEQGLLYRRRQQSQLRRKIGVLRHYRQVLNSPRSHCRSKSWRSNAPVFDPVAIARMTLLRPQSFQDASSTDQPDRSDDVRCRSRPEARFGAVRTVLTHDQTGIHPNELG